MRQQLRAWRSEQGSRLWLAMLVDAMEDRCGPQCSLAPDASPALEELRVQLSLPASPHDYPTSIFSFNN